MYGCVYKNIGECYKPRHARMRWSRMVEKSLALEIEAIAPKPSMDDRNSDDHRAYDIIHIHTMNLSAICTRSYRS